MSLRARRACLHAGVLVLTIVQKKVTARRRGNPVFYKIASSLKAPRNDARGANANYNVLLVIRFKSAHLLISSPQGVRIRLTGNFKYIWLVFIK
jgi:hypothetical protein